MQNNDAAKKSFENGTVQSAVLRNAVPAIISMLMVLIYNLADTFFIGQTHNDYMVAAVSLATPVFLIYMALGSLFGLGGTSVISRVLGEKRAEYANKVSSFCMWASVVVGIVITVLLWVFLDEICILMGASADTLEYTKTYLGIVAGCGVFSMLSYCFSNIIRAEGKSTVAMMGMLIGNLLNVILDPIFILTFGWDVAGAAIATVIGNVVGALYYIVYFLLGKSSLSIHIRDFTVRDGVCKNVLAIGIPASLTSILMSVSQIMTNSFIAQYGDMPVAAYGVAMKVLQMVTLIGIGLGQGIQPLLGYCYGAKDKNRFYGAFRYSCIYGLIFCTAATALCMVFTKPIVNVFLTDTGALDYAVTFSRILLSTAWLFGVFYTLANALQGIGAATPSFWVSISRQGLIYIPMAIILNLTVGLNGLVAAQPIVDVISLVLVAILLRRSLKRIDWNLPNQSEE